MWEVLFCGMMIPPTFQRTPFSSRHLLIAVVPTDRLGGVRVDTLTPKQALNGPSVQPI